MVTVLYVWRSMAILAGIERAISIKINWLASHGYKVVLVTYEQGSHPLAFSLHPDVRVFDLKTPFHVLSKYPIYKRWLYYLRMKSVFLRRLRDVIEDVHPDVVLTIAGCMNVIKEIYKACSFSKLIIESHETFFSVIKEPMYINNPILKIFSKIYDKRCLYYIDHFDRLVSLTYGDVGEWRKHISIPLNVIPNPIPHYPFSLNERTNNTYFRIISAGRLEEVKGFDRLIKAFAIIEKKCPKWRVDIFGKGSCEDELRKLIASYHLEKRIKILPPTNNIYSEYQNSDFYVLSSYHEGLGMVLLEAMACGIPCVSFNCDYGPREIIVDKVTGILVEDGNVEKLAQEILWMVEHHKERLEMGNNACEAIKKYSVDTIMQKWTILFDELFQTTN